MPRRNRLVESPPFPVEQTIRHLGENLRIARIRRNMTIAEAAERIGTGPRAVMDAEKGSASTGMVVYAALLWLYDKLDQLDEVGDPFMDKEGLSLEAIKERKRVRRGKGINSDF
jgi:transcriptional regulator with XRE-family HTH domain